MTQQQAQNEIDELENKLSMAVECGCDNDVFNLSIQLDKLKKLLPDYICEGCE